jgi:primosomal protein N' (replication factor Y)
LQRPPGLPQGRPHAALPPLRLYPARAAACPSCGNPDILPLGKGTEQLEEELERLLRNVQRPDGNPARVARIDADTTKAKGALEQQLAQVHAASGCAGGHADGGQGHDFRRITLVAAVQPDGALFSSDFRAPERLFCLLMQAAGRAGRDARMCRPGQPSRDVGADPRPAARVQALRQHDYPLCQRQLREREDAGMPPFAFQALVRADARTQEAAQAFLRAASRRHARPSCPIWTRCSLPAHPHGGAARGQCGARPDAAGSRQPQRAAALSACLAALAALAAHLPEHKGLVRWLVDVDPLSM